MMHRTLKTLTGKRILLCGIRKCCIKKQAYTEDEWRIVMGKPLTLWYVDAGKYVKVLDTGKIYYIDAVTKKRYKGRPYKTWSLREMPRLDPHWIKGAEAKKMAVEIMVLVPEA
jgi:hypothetical protein